MKICGEIENYQDYFDDVFRPRRICVAAVHDNETGHTYATFQSFYHRCIKQQLWDIFCLQWTCLVVHALVGRE